MTINQGYPHPIAYTFEADVHCPICTAEAFGTDASGFVSESARDGEGNPIGAIAPWDEWETALVCGTCGGVIADGPEDEGNEDNDD